MRVRRAGWIAALAALGMSTTAGAAPEFTQGKPIGNGQTPVAAMANDGAVFVAWVQGNTNGVYTSRRSATDKSFRKQLDIGGKNVVPGSLAVVRDSGTAAVAWAEGTPSDGRVKVAVAAPAFGDPETIPGGSDPTLALAPNGDILLGYTAGGAAYTVLRPAGGKLGSGNALSGATTTPQLVAAPGGGWRAAWIASGGDPAIFAADAGADGIFGSPLQLSNSANDPIGPLELAVNRSGETVAAWMAASGGTATVDAALRLGGGDWQPSTTLSPVPAGGALDLHASVNDAGDAVVGWMGDSIAEGFNDQLGTAFRPAGGAFGAAVVRADITDPFAPIALGLDSAGGIFAVRAAGTEKKVANAILREREGVPGGDTPISVPERGLAGLSAAADPFGNGVVVWASTEAANPVSVAVYSRAAPKASAVGLLKDGLRLTLDEPARVTFTIKRGRDDVGNERVATPGAGTSTIAFDKRVKKFVKRGGSYKVRIVLSDAGRDVRVFRGKLQRQ